MSSLLEQIRVLRALIVRDLMMRYGREGGGFVWVIIEPMLLCVGVTAVWMIIKPGFEKGVVVSALVFTGYMPLTLWRHISNLGVHIFRKSGLLFYHRPISILDIFWSRIILEFTAASTAFLIVYIALIGFGFVEPIYDWSLCLLGWLIMAYVATAASLLFAVATEIYEWSEKIVQPFQYLLIPLSGTFFIVDWLPESIREIIWYNPLVHIYEIIRSGFIGPSINTYATWWYPISFSTVVFVFGFLGIARARRNISL